MNEYLRRRRSRRHDFLKLTKNTNKNNREEVKNTFEAVENITVIVIQASPSISYIHIHHVKRNKIFFNQHKFLVKRNGKEVHEMLSRFRLLNSFIFFVPLSFLFLFSLSSWASTSWLWLNEEYFNAIIIVYCYCCCYYYYWTCTYLKISFFRNFFSLRLFFPLKEEKSIRRRSGLTVQRSKYFLIFCLIQRTSFGS
jgi:hypothetical protein